MTNLPIGQLLMEKKYINQIQLDQALIAQKEKPEKRLGDVLIDLGFIKEEDKLHVLSERLNVPLYQGFELQVKNDIARLISEEIARKYQVMPLEIKDNGLVLAMNDPLDFYALEDIKSSCGIPVTPILAPALMISNAINRSYSAANISSAMDEMQREVIEDSNFNLEQDIAELTQRVDNAPVVKFVNNMIRQAYEVGSSDMHIEPFDKTTVIRFRIDGVLKEFAKVSKSVHEGLITRLKIMGNMNIAEKRVPQDGYLDRQIEGKSIDIRLSSIPTVYGEKMVIRLLGHSLQQLDKLNDLGLNENDHNKLSYLIKHPHGILLFTGPTGSGKTTTLYAILREIATDKVNVITVEDPVEKRVFGVNQIQVNPKAGLTFATALRSILRQDPDVIMVGEIRDEETAEIAVRSAITGHLVLSTIHTNDTATAIARLKDMKVESYLLSSSVIGIVAQRLVRILCPYCKEKVKPTAEETNSLNGYEEPIYKACGCPKCNNLGYKGRTALFEIMVINNSLKELIIQNADPSKIQDLAVQEGMTTLADSMRAMVIDGITSMDELVRVVYSI